MGLFFGPVEIITKAEFCDPLVPIDFRNHRSASFQLNLNLNNSSLKDNIQLNYVKGDYGEINNKLETLDWDFINSGEDINTVTDEFYTKCNSAISDHVPSHKVFNS